MNGREHCCSEIQFILSHFVIFPLLVIDVAFYSSIIGMQRQDLASDWQDLYACRAMQKASYFNSNRLTKGMPCLVDHTRG
jgi:hypothetical protein